MREVYQDITSESSYYPNHVVMKIFENVSEGIMVTDVNKKILVVNPAFEKVTGFKSEMVTIAQSNALEAGFADLITFKQMQATDFTTKLTDGVIISNPPYGERIGEKEIIEQVISDLGKVMNQYPTWSVYLLSSMENLEALYGKKATKKRKLFNGFIRTDLYQFWGQRS